MRRHLNSQAAIVVGAISMIILAFPQRVLAGTFAQVNVSVSTGWLAATALFSEPGSWGSPQTDDRESGVSSASDAPPPPCYDIPASPSVSAELGSGGGPGTWYVAYCTNPLTYLNDPRPAVFVPSGPAITASPAVPALLEQAVSQTAFVDPSIGLNPPGEQVVNLPTWLWIAPSNWKAAVASASAGPVTTTVTATPTGVVWNLGNGVSMECSGPGVPYSPNDPNQSTYCSYAWPESSDNEPDGVFVVTATIEYQVTTTVTGAADPTPDLGIHFGPSSSVDVPVSEIEALGTSP